MDSDTEPKLISLISQLQSRDKTDSEDISLVIQIMSLVRSMDLDWQPKPESKLMSLITQTVFVFNSMDLDSLSKPLSDLISQKIYLIKTPIDTDSEPEAEFMSLVAEMRSLHPVLELLLLIHQILSLFISPEPGSKLISLITKLMSIKAKGISELASLNIQTMSLEESMDMDLQPKPELEVMSLVSQAISVFNSMDMDSQSKLMSNLVSIISRKNSNPMPELSYDIFSQFISTNMERGERQISYERESIVNLMDSDFEPSRKLISPQISLDHYTNSELKLISLVTELVSTSWTRKKAEVMSLISQIISLVSSMDIANPESELMSLVSQAVSVFNSMDLDSQPESLSGLISFISQQISLGDPIDSKSKLGLLVDELLSISSIREDVKVMSLITQIISQFNYMDIMNPESELMSVISQAVYDFNTMDLDSQPEALPGLISLIIQNLSLIESTESPDDKFTSLVAETGSLEPVPKLISLIHQIFSLIVSMTSRWKKFIFVCPQVKIRFEEGKVYEEAPLRSNNKWDCLPGEWEIISSTEEGPTPFLCKCCNGQNHQEYKQAPAEVKHPLHPKHSLHLTLLDWDENGKGCYCCDRGLREVIYYCLACDFAMDFSCVEKPPVFSIDHPKWHEHTLALFSRTTSLTCDVCALADSTCPFYICPPCGFVVHQRCLSLPHVIKISRHVHRISFTPSFQKGDWSCGVCRRKIDNDYGSYSCIKDGCSYAAHARCATQNNVWDGEELENVPEEIEEELLESFVRISDGIIQHFSHPHHHLRLDENMDRDYNDNKLCQACVTPIYFGNFYSCMECDYIMHETCAELPRKIYHPIHPHMLILVTDNGDVIDATTSCDACPRLCTGFFYECGLRWCTFRVHVQCATISEPLYHESHMHPLFLTSKPGERKRCGVCNDSRHHSKHSRYSSTYETFNCIEECGFSLCFGCATLPYKVRYKHDKHILTLSYGEETSSTVYWCEVCEGKVNSKGRFYRCDEYCCVTIHIKCLVKKDLYMKPGLSLSYNDDGIIKVVPNNHRISRPLCSRCGVGKRCPFKFVFMFRKSVYCSLSEAFWYLTYGGVEFQSRTAR